MAIKRVVLSRSPHDVNEWLMPGNVYSICNRGLRQWFKFPEDTQQVDICIGTDGSEPEGNETYDCWLWQRVVRNGGINDEVMYLNKRWDWVRFGQTYSIVDAIVAFGKQHGCNRMAVWLEY